MRLAICGSRRWTDYDAFCEQLPDLSAYDTIVSGCEDREPGKGVDSMAWMLAKALSKRYVGMPPDRHKPFRQAAHERNQRIVDASDALVAFPGPRSTGTWDTVRRAKEKGIPVMMRKAAK